MPAPVYVVATGLITAIGEDTASCLDALREGRTGIDGLQILETAWADEIPAGEVRLSNNELAEKSGAPGFWPRTALLGLCAVKEAWRPFAAKNTPPYPVGFLNATTVGGMDRTERVYARIAGDGADPEDFIYHECGAITRLIAGEMRFDGFSTTVSTACSSSANSIALAAQLIRSGMLHAAVAGGADGLCRFTLNGFNTLGILDRQLCQPFDGGRRGLNLGEGAGYLTLMSGEGLRAWDATPIGIVSGWGNAADAYHQTASSPEGTGNKLAMGGALRVANLSPADISYINLHGTGTPNNDSSEGRAIEAVFGVGSVPPASSTKAFTGHTLGAAGGVEAVFSALAIREGLVFPNLRWSQQMDDISFSPATELLPCKVRHVLSNSFGFGGACSSLILSAC